MSFFSVDVLRVWLPCNPDECYMYEILKIELKQHKISAGDSSACVVLQLFTVATRGQWTQLVDNLWIYCFDITVLGSPCVPCINVIPKLITHHILSVDTFPLFAHVITVIASTWLLVIITILFNHHWKKYRLLFTLHLYIYFLQWLWVWDTEMCF